ncbi:MAG: hypothetical protein ACOX6I_05930, partial [Syntrophomonadaceae bacterium]
MAIPDSFSAIIKYHPKKFLTREPSETAEKRIIKNSKNTIKCLCKSNEKPPYDIMNVTQTPIKG